MTTALLENHPEFVEFFLEQELIEISTYLNAATLNMLYNSIDDASFLQSTLICYGIKKGKQKQALTKAVLAATTANILGADTGVVKDANRNLELIRTQKKRSGVVHEWVDLPTIATLMDRLIGSFQSLHYAENSVNQLYLIYAPYQIPANAPITNACGRLG